MTIHLPPTRFQRSRGSQHARIIGVDLRRVKIDNLLPQDGPLVQENELSVIERRTADAGMVFNRSHANGAVHRRSTNHVSPQHTFCSRLE
jgi:hypothetical protein